MLSVELCVEGGEREEEAAAPLMESREADNVMDLYVWN